MYPEELSNKLKSLFPLYPSIDFDYVHSNELVPWPIGFQSRSPEGLKQKLVAAIVAEFMGVTISTALKKIPDHASYGAMAGRVDQTISEICAQELKRIADSLATPVDRN
ncbi:MAG: hypothetical protein ACXWLZ_04160, partial [Rhizomicrobium sp.]